jgi:hypothetical protein
MTPTPTETALRENDRSLTNLEQIACELEWLRQDLKNESVPKKLVERIKDVEVYLDEAREEDDFRRQRVAELEAASIRMTFDLGRRDNDIAILLANVEGLLEDIGGGLDREDMIIIRQIEFDLKDRRAASLLNAESVREGEESSHVDETCKESGKTFAGDPGANEALKAYISKGKSLLYHTPPDTKEAPVPSEVERVARAIYSARIAGGKNYCDFDDLCTNGHNDTYEKLMADAAAAIAALSLPGIDRGKVEEIREWYNVPRHTMSADDQVHAYGYIEALLQMIEGEG